MIRADYNINTNCTCSEPRRVMGFEKTIPKKNNNTKYDGNKENTER
jgi:hypothetical protein